MLTHFFLRALCTNSHLESPRRFMMMVLFHAINSSTRTPDRLTFFSRLIASLRCLSNRHCHEVAIETLKHPIQRDEFLKILYLPWIGWGRYKIIRAPLTIDIKEAEWKKMKKYAADTKTHESAKWCGAISQLNRRRRAVFEIYFLQERSHTKESSLLITIHKLWSQNSYAPAKDMKTYIYIPWQALRRREEINR